MSPAREIARNTALPIAARRLALAAALAGRTLSHLDMRWRVVRTMAPPRPLPPKALGPLGPIWVFWAQGLEEAPAVVRTCVASIRQHAGDREVRVLSAATARDFVDIPAIVLKKGSDMGWAKFANALRLALLVRYGGTWIDATVLQTAAMPQTVLQAELVLPSLPHPARLIDNWFIHARANHPLLIAWLDAFLAYWELDLRIRPYYQMHYMMEGLAIYSASADAMLAAAAAPMAAGPCLGLPWATKDPGDTAWQAQLARSWVHKLTHKLGNDAPFMRRLADLAST